MDLHQTLTNFDSFLCNSSIINEKSKSTARAKRVSLLESRFAALKEQQRKTSSKSNTSESCIKTNSYKAKRNDFKNQSKHRKKELFYDCKHGNKLSIVSLKDKYHFTHRIPLTGSSLSHQRCNIVHDDILYSLEPKDNVEYSLVDPSSQKVIFKQTERCIPVADSIAESHLSGYETCINDSHPLSVTTSESSLSSSCKSIARQNSDSLVQQGSIRQGTTMTNRQSVQSKSCSFKYGTSGTFKTLKNPGNFSQEITSPKLQPPDNLENCYNHHFDNKKSKVIVVSQEENPDDDQKLLEDRFEKNVLNSYKSTLLDRKTYCSISKNNEALKLMLLPSAKSFDRACSPLLTHISTSSSASRKTFSQERQGSLKDENPEQSLLGSDHNYSPSTVPPKNHISSQFMERNNEIHQHPKLQSCLFSNKLVQTSVENLVNMEPTSTELSFTISSAKSSHTSFMDKIYDISRSKRPDKVHEDLVVLEYVSSAEQVAEKNFPKATSFLSDKEEPPFANLKCNFVKPARVDLCYENHVKGDPESCQDMSLKTKLNLSENRVCSAVGNQGKKVNRKKPVTVSKYGLSFRDQNKQLFNTATKLSAFEDTNLDKQNKSKLKSPKAVQLGPRNCESPVRDHQIYGKFNSRYKTDAPSNLAEETFDKSFHGKVRANDKSKSGDSLVQDQKVERGKFGNYSFTPLTRMSMKLTENSSEQLIARFKERKSKRFKACKTRESDFQKKNGEVKDVSDARKTHSDCCNKENTGIKKQVQPARLTIGDGATAKLSSNPAALTSAQKIRAKKRQSLAVTASSSSSSSRIKPPSERSPAVTKLASRIAKNAASEREKSVASSGSLVGLRKSSTNLASAAARRQQKAPPAATARKSVRAPSAKLRNPSTVKERANASKRPSSSLQQRKKLLDEKARAKEKQEREEEERKRKEEAAAEEKRKRKEEHERNIQMKVEMLRKRKDQLLQSIEMQRLKKKATDETFCEVHDQQSMTSTKLDVLERIFDMRKKDLSDAQNRFIDMRSRISELDNVIKQLDVTNYFEPVKYKETLSSFEEKFSQLSIDIKHKEDEEVRILSENESEKSLLVGECAIMRDKVMEENRSCFDLMQKYKQHKKTLEEKQQQQNAALQVASSNEAAAQHSGAE